MSGSDRRTFVRRAAAVSAAAAAASLVPGTSVGRDLGQSLSQAGLTWRKTPCRLCGVGCGLLVGLEGGRAVAVRGDPESPVSRGLACVKGYHSVQALYGRDRFTAARVRRGGRLVEVPMEEALDLVARKLREAVDGHGKDSVGLYGSGQWTIPAGYVANKLFKGALGTNNIDADARLSTASAMTGLASTFGLDGATGCYEDIEHADLFVLWNANLAETHPVLFSRMLQRRQEDPRVRIVDLSTRTTRTSYAADRALLYAPQSDLAVANAICHEIAARGRDNRDFIQRHVAFRKGRTGIGYGLGDETRFADDPSAVTYDEYVRFLATYTPERAQALSGLPAADIRWLASVYADPGLKVMSVWCTGLNQHSRGTWINNLIHNIHLLVGKVAVPGNSALPLTEQPSECGSAREAGALAHALPRGTVANPEDRALAAQIWGVPVSNIDPRPGHHAISLFRALERGAIRFLWVQGSNPMVDLPNLRRYRGAAREGDRFLVVSDAYPTRTTDVADVVLPAALWFEQEGLYGSAERRTQHFEQMVEPPGEAMSDAWQTIEVARRLGYGSLFPWARDSHVAGIWAEYARFHDSPAHRLAPLSELKSRPGLLWPYTAGEETKWRYNTATDPAADPARGAFDFYGHPDGRAWIWLRPHEPAAETPDADYPFWLGIGRVLEHTGTGTLTRRIPTLHRAVPGSYVEVNGSDASALGIRNGDRIRLVSRRGSLMITARIDHRAQPPRGQVFVPAFDDSLLVNELTLDAHCPISGQPDYGKCAVRLERVGGSAG